MSEKIIKEILIYNGKIIKVKRNLTNINHKLAFREIVEHAEGVCIIPVLNNQILFVKQFRSGVQDTLIELPAGLVDSGESTSDAALRELAEETGYSSSKLTYLGAYYTSPGFSNEKVHLFLAEDLFSHFLNPDDEETIEILKYPITDIKKLLMCNTFLDMKTTLGLNIFLNNFNNNI